MLQAIIRSSKLKFNPAIVLKRQSTLLISCYEAAITGYVLSGASSVQIQKVTGLSAYDIEQVIINKKLSVKP